MSKKAIIILALVILLLVAIACGMFFYIGNSNKSNVPKNPGSVVPAVTSGGVKKVNLANPPINGQNNPQQSPTRELNSSDQIPAVSLNINKDVSQGYNLKINSNGFSIFPENTTEDLESTKGYYKLYINNSFQTRIYSSDHYIRGLKPGKYSIKVELSDTKGRTLTKDGKNIESTIEFEAK